MKSEMNRAAMGVLLGSLPAHAALTGGFDTQAQELWGTIKTQREQLFDLSAHHKDGELDRINRALAHLVSESSPSLVKITIPNPMGSGASVGSGFIVDAGGLVVTNAHVVDAPPLGAEVKVEVDGRKTKAKLVARSMRKDVALLQLQERQQWPALPLGSSIELKPGYMVVAMGYPLGLPLSASMGIISGTERAMPAIFVKPIQTDATVNPGNSGGPLLSVDGSVVGVNTFIMSESGGSEGLSFAIPVETVKHLLVRHRAGGRIESGSLGITIGSVTIRGAIIVEVAPGSAAEKAAIKAGDIMTSMDGVSLVGGSQDASTELIMRLSDKFAGEPVVLNFDRNGKPYVATAVLGEYQAPKNEGIPWPGKRRR